MENVLTLATEDLVNSNALQISVNEDGIASTVGMPVNVVPAEGSYVLKQLEDGTTVLLDAMTFLNHVGGQLVLDSAPVGTDLLTHSIFSTADADPNSHQLIQGLEPVTEEVPLDDPPPPPAEPQMTSVEVLLAEAPDLLGTRRSEPGGDGGPLPQPPPTAAASQQSKRRVPRLFPPEPDEDPPGPAPWPCPQCGRRFNVWKRYQNHVKSHDYEKPFRCDQCPETFNFEKNLQLHRVTHNSGELQCPDCERTFRRAASLRAHLAVHQLEEAIICPQCQQDFSTQALLDKHLPVHSAAGEVSATGRPQGLVDTPAADTADGLVNTTEFVVVRPPPSPFSPPGTHYCAQCKLTFSSEGQLQEHARAHEKIQSLLTVKSRRRRSKPGSHSNRTRCKICQKTFAKAGLLTRHMLIHTGERPFQCDQCDRAFNQKNALKIHVESKHGKLRPYSCQLCRLTFAQKGNLRNHVRRVHNLSEASRRPYKCSQCGCGFASSGVLSSHISKMHDRPPDGQIGTDALRDLVKQLLEYSVANEAARDRIHAQIADIADAMGDEELPSVLGGLVGAVQRGEVGAAAAAAAVTREARAAAAGQTEMAVVEGEQCQTEVLTEEVVDDIPLDVDDPLALPGVTVLEDVEPTAAPPPPPPPPPLPPPVTPAQAYSTATGTTGTTTTSTTGTTGTTGGGTAKHRPAIITIVDKMGWAGGNRRIWANSDGDQAAADGTSSSAGGQQHQGRKYLVRVRYDGNLRWFQCLFCTKEFRKPYDLVRHLRIHTKDKPFKCSQCHRTFTVRSGLEAHMRVHRGIKLASCPICEKKFATASVLRVHLRVHTGAKPYSCQYCQKPFRTLGNKNIHEASHRGGDLDERGNDIRAQRRKAANTSYVDVQLEPPIRITDDGSLVQEDKRRRLPSAGDVVPSADRPHRCPVCQVAFKKSSHMRQHLRQHTGERPHQCHLCSKSFITSSALTSHERTHSGARFFKCPICASAFTTASSMKRHMSTHTEERPFMCPYCHRRFKTRMICKRHTRTHKMELARGMNQPRPDGDAATGADGGGGGVEPSQEPAAVSAEGGGGGGGAEGGAGGGGAALFPSLMSTEEEDQLLSAAGLTEGGYTARAQNVSVIVDEHGRMVQCELAPGGVQTLTAAEDGSVTITDLTEHRPATQTGLDDQLTSELTQPLFPAPELTAAGLTETDKPSAAAAAAHEQALMMANIAAISRSDDEPVPVPEVALEAGPAAGAVPPPTAGPAVHADPDSDDDEALRLRNEQDGQMILEMDADNILLQDPSLSQPLIHRCGICKKMFTTRLALTTHEELHSVRSDVSLVEAASAGVVVAEQPQQSQQSAAAGQPTEAHLCAQCLTVFSSAQQLAAHRLTHETPPPPAPPPPPPVQPPQQQQSQPAAAQSAGTGPARVSSPAPADPLDVANQCQHCRASFVNAATLKKHIAREHGRTKRKHKSVIRLSEKLTARLAEQPLNVSRSQAEICLIQSAVEKVQNGPVPRAEPEDTPDVLLKHRCSVCSKAFRKPSDLVRHVRIHTGEKPYSCEICLKRFTVKSTLLGHLRTHSGQRDFHCLVCKASFTTKCALRVHSRLHTGARPFQCEVCGRWFRTSGHRSIHMSTHGWQRGRRSAATGDTAADAVGETVPGELQVLRAGDGSRLVSAVLSDGDDGPGDRPPLMGMLDDLTAEVTVEDGKTAGADGGSSQPQTQPGPLDDDEEDVDDPTAPPAVQPQSQLRLKAESDPVAAGGGGSVLQLEPGLAEQLQLVLAAQSSSPGGTATTLSGDTELRVQLQIDAEGRIVGVEALQASVDGSSTAAAAAAAEPPPPPDAGVLEVPEPVTRPDREQARTLRQVVAGVLQEGGIGGSSGAGVLTCSICQRSFTSQSQWRRHMRSHGVEVRPPAAAAGRTPHACVDCPASFSTASLLARHRRTHTGERPFQCDQCDRAFSQKNTLRIHMRTHLGERPHTCPFCGHGFAQKGNMRTHIRRAHLKRAIDTLELDARATDDIESAA